MDTRLFARTIGLGAALLLAGCYPMRDTTRPPATKVLPAPTAATRVVIVLPGIRDNLDSLEASGIGGAIQGAWRDADVELVELTMGYYKDGKAVPDVHALVEAARGKGYRQVWLAGASLGGMGALLYDTAHPGTVDGLVLFSPYLGDDTTLAAIRKAGGLAQWQPPSAATPGPDNWQGQMWRRAKEWSAQPGGDPRVWLAYGAGDKFAPNMPLLLPAIPKAHVVTGPGEHAWTTWTPLATQVFIRAK
jgi:pimeloyl-ACP methyl ester carboxylesterase